MGESGRQERVVDGKEWKVGESGSSVGLLYMVTETLFWEQKNMAPHKGLKTLIPHPSFILVVPFLGTLLSDQITFCVPPTDRTS